jgi:cell wall assembly regulator SMI1
MKKGKTIKHKPPLSAAQGLLARNLRKSDGMSAKEIESVEDSLGVEIPKALREFYLHTGGLEMFMSSFHRFIEPYIKDNMLVFWKKIKALVTGA